jgi:nitrogen-specific signal transduction histidine kinase
MRARSRGFPCALLAVEQNNHLCHRAFEAWTSTSPSTKKASTRNSPVLAESTCEGISPEHQAQVFEPLYTTKPEGTGLGLYLVREIVAAHEGHIAMQSDVGSGTTITVTLPCLEGEQTP